MYTLKDVAREFGLKINTLRYWLKRNNDDFENNCYNFNLKDLTQRIVIHKRICSSKKITRGYEQIMILDLEEFKEEFNKYISHIENLKKRKRFGNLYWTDAAIECYWSKMNCEKCFNRDICSSVANIRGEPPMKNVVKRLLSCLGEPQIRNSYS